jgi:phage head maturation protease
VPSNEDRDLVSADALVEMRTSMAAAVGRLREQLESIDARHGRAVTRLVPAGDTVLRLRAAVVAGDVPGVSKQSELFRDALGHASQPTMDAVTYAWFAALYEQSPVGLTALRDPDDGDSADRQQVLQELAWDAVREEPLALV